MRIALINENSQAAKNEMIYASLKKVAESKGHTVDNYGMYSADDKAQLTYVQNGILAAILLNSGAADFVVTGCGTGEGAMSVSYTHLSRSPINTLKYFNIFYISYTLPCRACKSFTYLFNRFLHAPSVQGAVVIIISFIFTFINVLNSDSTVSVRCV